MNSPTPSKAELKAVLATDFYSFLRRALPEVEGEPLVEAQYLELLCCHLKEVANGSTTRLIINMPPRYLKTLVTSVIWVAWMLAKDPTKKFAIISHNDTLTRAIARKLKSLIETSWYRSFAPNVQIRPDRDVTRDFELTAGGGVLLTTVGTGITGRGFDVIILDDPQSANDIMSDVEREKLLDLLDESISSRLDDQVRGAIVLVQQRLRDGDLTGRLRARGGWEHLSLPLKAPDDVTYECGDFVWRRQAGEVLCPERFSVADVEKLQAQNTSKTFQTQFQQSPSAVTGDIIRPEHIQRVSALPPSATRITVSVDTATKALPTSDYTVFLVIASDSTRHYVIDVIRGRLEVTEMRDIAIRLFGRYRIEKFLIEDSAAGSGLGNVLYEKGYPAELRGTKNKNKIERLEACFHFFVDQRLFVVGDAPWTAAFIDELVRFTVAEYDDQVDALTLYLLETAARRPIKAVVLGAGGTSKYPFPVAPKLNKGDNPLRPRTRTPPHKVFP